MEKKLGSQMQFFEMLRAKAPKNEVLADIVADSLSCSRDGAYRRISGRTELSLPEATKLAQDYSLSLNHLIGSSQNSVVFGRGNFIRSINDFQQYLESSLKQLKKILEFRDHHMIYQAKDIPIYYQFAFPKLGAFKMYVWLKSVYNIQKLNGENYDLSMLPDELKALAKELWETYSRIHTTEIWNDTTIQSIINQLEYYYEAGLLSSREEALAICDELLLMMKMVYRQALNNRKANPHNHEEDSGAHYAMYYHEILIMDNHILTQLSPYRKVYFLPYAGINFLHTEDPLLTKDVSEYLEEQKNKSSLLSTISEKERNKFFIRIKRRIDRLRENLMNMDPFM